MTGIYAKPRQWYTKSLYSVNRYAPVPHAATATGLLLVLIPLIAAKSQEKKYETFLLHNSNILDVKLYLL
jgi:hypothetical protein